MLINNLLLTHNFPKPHEHNILNIEVYPQWFPVGAYFEFLDRVHHKMKLEAAFKGIMKILENLKISLNVHAKSKCEGVYFSKVADFL